MTRSFDFSLPEAPARRGRGLVPFLSLLGTVGCLGFLVALWLRTSPDATPANAGAANASAADPKRIAEAAEELERRTLYREAAETWREYAERAALPPIEAADVLFRRAKNLVEAGEWSEGVRLLTRYEKLDISAKSRRRAQELTSECLSALGKEDARAYVVRSSTSSPATKTGGEAGESPLVVARVGADDITLEDLRDRLALDVRDALHAQHPDFPAVEIERQADAIARKTLGEKETLEKVVADAVRTEVLYRQGLEEGFGTDADTRRAIDTFRRRYLADRVVLDHMQSSVAALTPVDLKNHFDAHPDRWVEKAKVEFSFHEFPDEASARTALEAGIGEFTAAEGPAVEGEPLPGLGRNAEATAHLLALDEGAVGDRPIEVGEHWYIFRADQKHERRPKTFEEAREEVRTDLLATKQREALARLEAELSIRFHVFVDQDAIARAAKDTKDAQETKAAGDGSDPAPPGGATQGGSVPEDHS